MSPWNVLGWILVAAIAGWVLWVVLVLRAAVWSDVARGWRLKRANAGRLNCQAVEGCKERATRRTPNGFACETHRAGMAKKGAVSYSFMLDYVAKK